MLSSVRRHSLRLQSEIHRWSICEPAASRLIADGAPACMCRSKSCASSAGDSDGGSGRASRSSSSDSVLSAADALKPYRVALLGAGGVGKSAFACIFSGAADSMDSDDCELCGDEVRERELEVDGEATSITLLDTWDAESASDVGSLQSADAFLLLYSITDRASFLRASELRIGLRRLRPAGRAPIILVGNKCDLVRRREVSTNEGRACAAVLDCKFIETSAAVQHNVWEAFRGVVRQLRLRRRCRDAKRRPRRESLPAKAKRFLDKMVARNNPGVAFWLKSKSCHDLSVL
ncbi:GTP-binding protein GEM [Syngnathoides biaculeatus]|uniref:GTP-binding protein GEM n=1 Tax=Syngnathoides biaculeatus TaxID=300417 RepID=UPI002ADE84DE|nr:GTP-binding protein GEM [Syngnathoides biaculeatus]